MILKFNMRMVVLLVVLLSSLAMSACNRPNFDPKLAMPPYPYELHTTNVLPIQVFRDRTYIEIVNSTDQSWSDLTVWINQRFAAKLKRLQAGERVSMDLFTFRDDLGEQFRAGGLLRTRPAAKVELVELQSGLEQPLVGLISVMPGQGE